MITLKKAPAIRAWDIICNGNFIQRVLGNRNKAHAEAQRLADKYGLEFEG